MKLNLSQIIPSPLSTHLQLANALENRDVFLLADKWKILLVHPSGVQELIWQTTDEEVAGKWRGFFDERLSDSIYEEIRRRSDGFRLLSKKDYGRIEVSDLYKSANSLPGLYEGHDGILVAFAGKKISILKFDGDTVMEQAETKTKGKDLICQALHPGQNLIVYGTNHGELFGQPFSKDQFGKSIKIDQLPNTCYQVTFSADGRRLFVAGLGFVKCYDFNGTEFTPHMLLATAVRSFELVEDYLVLNKGMHGIDVLKVREKPERVTSMDLPFAVDKMYYLAAQRTFLLTSGSTSEWALASWVI